MIDPAQYLAMIPPANAAKPKFMAQVGLVTGALAAISQAAQSLVDSFDLDLAQGAQLDVLGQWIGQSRVIHNLLTIEYFGFSEVTDGTLDGDTGPFGELGDPTIGAPFYDLGDPLGATTKLSDAQYRLILRAVIVRNTYDGTLGQMETALAFVFGGAVSVLDGGALTLNLVVAAKQDTTIQALISNNDVLPRPAGVRFGIISYGVDLEIETGDTLDTESGLHIFLG